MRRQREQTSPGHRHRRRRVSGRSNRGHVRPEPRRRREESPSPGRVKASREPWTRPHRPVRQGLDPPAAFDRSLQPDSPSSSYQITLSLGPDTLRRGVNPLGVLDELRELGESTVTTDPQAVPLLDELDPERCYLSWIITVRTDAEPERLRD